jgi:L-ribulokinase
MQVLADVLNMEIKVARSDQTVALGAAMFAAVVGGIFPDIFEAQEKMAGGIEAVFEPRKAHLAHYQSLYEKYKKIGVFVENRLT